MKSGNGEKRLFNRRFEFWQWNGPGRTSSKDWPKIWRISEISGKVQPLLGQRIPGCKSSWQDRYSFFCIPKGKSVSCHHQGLRDVKVHCERDTHRRRVEDEKEPFYTKIALGSEVDKLLNSSSFQFIFGMQIIFFASNRTWKISLCEAKRVSPEETEGGWGYFKFEWWFVTFSGHG